MRKCKVLFAILPIFLLFILLSLPASATQSRVIDKGNLLTAQEVAGIEASLAGLTEKTGASAFLVTTRGYETLDSMRSELGVGSGDNVILLVVTLDGGTYYYDLYTSGAADSAIRSGEVDDILDDYDVYYNLKDGNLVAGVAAFADVTAKAYLTDTTRGTRIFWSVLLGLVAGAVPVIIVSAKYRRRVKSPIYPLSRYASLNLTASNDLFIGSHVTKTRIQSSSSSSGGHSSSGHGGGGGHRGGR